jgi:hypothetical protein
LVTVHPRGSKEWSDSEGFTSMGEAFDPYYKWLGIPPEEQPPSHYRLLGIRDFESDPDVVQAAADQRMAHLRTYQTSRHADWSQRLLNEVASAKICLLTAVKRTAYDQRLRESRQPKPAAAQPSGSAAASDLAFDIAVDEPRPRALSALHAKRQMSVGARIASAIAIGTALVAGLVYWSTGLSERPASVAKHGGRPIGPNHQAGTEAAKPQTESSASKEKPGDNAGGPVKGGPENVAVRGGHKPSELSHPSGPPPSQSATAAVASPRTPRPATLTVAPGAESAPPEDLEDVLPYDGQLKMESPQRDPSVPAAAKQNEAARPASGVSKDDLSKVKTRNPLDPTTAAAGTARRSTVPMGRWFPLLTSPNKLTGWETEGCRFSYVNRVIDLRGEAMFCPIAAKDATIRVKVKRHTPSCVRLILRNSEQGCYFAQLTYSNWSIVKLTRKEPVVDAAPGWANLWGDRDVLNAVPVTHNYSDVVFEISFAATGNALTVLMNGVPLLKARDTTFTQGTVGIGTDSSVGLMVTDVEMLIPKGSFIADHRPPARPAKP